MTNKTERENLVEEANELGLEFAPNIGDKKLKQMIEDALNETPENKEISGEPKTKNSKNLTRLQEKNIKIGKRKKEALKTKIVTITNKDARESGVVTTVHLSFENNHFGVAKNVPLDVPVELEVALINIAEKTLMTLHKDEIKDGKRTGNKIPTRVKKFAVSYGDNE